MLQLHVNLQQQHAWQKTMVYKFEKVEVYSQEGLREEKVAAEAEEARQRCRSNNRLKLVSQSPAGQWSALS